MTPVGDPCATCTTPCNHQGECPVCARYARILESLRRAATPEERKSAERMRGVIYRLYVGRCRRCDTPVPLKSLLFGVARAADGGVKLYCGHCER
jgi:hypothetical protein